MNNLFHQMQQEAENRRELIKQLEGELEKFPPGNLHIHTSKNRIQYYMSFDSNSHNRKYIAKSQMEFVCSLAQKSYCRKVITTSQYELDLLEKFCSKLPKEEFSDIYYGLSPERQKLVTPIYLSDEDFVDLWQATPYTGLGFRENATSYPTKRGELVRSKSEVIIANLLYENGIPYKYECPCYLDEFGNVYPDFTILKVRTREIFYWEHFGLMDVPEYSEKALDKILLYERNDIFPGKDLIISHETARHPLDIEIVKDMIQVYLL